MHERAFKITKVYGGATGISWLFPNQLSVCIILLPLYLAKTCRLTSRLRRGVTIPWSAYSDECLRILETQKEFASDAFLIQLVKLRLLSERVAQIPWSGPGDVLARLPATFYLKSLEAELHHFKSNVPDELMDNSKRILGQCSTYGDQYYTFENISYVLECLQSTDLY